ncbi:uncharacterized protein LOC141524683 [Cotesia typhae]|uniref:uncharacterized protein LOC141524683 n=1 Tax=Cotesia typhae TaxID=2053667 RepID=UPI003D699D50
MDTPYFKITLNLRYILKLIPIPIPIPIRVDEKATGFTSSNYRVSLSFIAIGTFSTTYLPMPRRLIKSNNRRPPRSQYQNRNREPFTIEFELPIEYVENYHGRFKGDFQNYHDDNNDYALDDYGDDDADDRQLRVQVLKEGKKRLRIKLSRSDNFDTNKQSINGSNY